MPIAYYHELYLVLFKYMAWWSQFEEEQDKLYNERQNERALQQQNPDMGNTC